MKRKLEEIDVNKENNDYEKQVMQEELKTLQNDRQRINASNEDMKR